jgi:hypothetical protein
MRSLTFVFYSLVYSLNGVAFGQSQPATIAGTVLDPVGVAIENAAVQARDTATGRVSRAVASRTGEYSLANLPAGTYDISVNVAGLRAFQLKGVAADAAKTVRVDIHMEDTSQLGTLGEDRTAVAASQKRHTQTTGPTPRTADGKPDFSGVWWSPGTVDPGKPEWLPSAVATAKERLDNNGKDNPQVRCLPSPVLRLGPVFELVQSQAFIVVISDDDSPGFHQIYLDGRTHPQDPNPAWYGHNIGKWEGDTLVVDRVGFKEQAWLDQGAHPHSESLHVIERYRRPDRGHLETEITVEDPGVLAKPYTMKRVADLAPTEEIYEFICPENNQDAAHMVGK